MVLGVLVAADAKGAVQGYMALQRDVQTERTETGRQRDELEKEKRSGCLMPHGSDHRCCHQQCGSGTGVSAAFGPRLASSALIRRRRSTHYRGADRESRVRAPVACADVRFTSC